MSRYTLYKYTPRVMALLLSLVLILSCVPAVQAAESGTCGDDLTWYLSAGTLTISGSGEMVNYEDPSQVPWSSFRGDIFRLELPSGLKTVGDVAFYGCENLTAAVIPDSVTYIGNYTFAHCTDLELLRLGGNVRTIGTAAFSDCINLKSVELPGSITSIGMKAFYRCESIATVTVPDSVSSMGVSVFAYCKNLVSANIQANIQTLPEYMFYGCEHLASVVLPDTTDKINPFSFRGCENLTTVYYGGNQSVDNIKSSIGAGLPNFTEGGSVTDQGSDGPVTSVTGQENDDGSITQENITVNQGSDTSVTVKEESIYQPGSTESSEGKTDINVTIIGDKGWEEATENVQKELDKIGDTSGNVTIDVYVKDTNEINSDFVDSLAGKDVNLTITTQNGSVWKMDASQLESGKLSGKYNLSYNLTAGTQELSDELGTHASFSLKFVESAQVNSEILIRLGNTWAFQEATLFQRNKDGLVRIQTVVVDRDGYAHFYLAAVDKDTEYCIGMNLPETEDTPIVPEEMLSDYGNAVNYTPIQYEITGRTSSWGMNLGQVMGILAVVMVSVVVIVGAVMYIMNKRRLKAGYVPQWDDEEE